MKYSTTSWFGIAGWCCTAMAIAIVPCTVHAQAARTERSPGAITVSADGHQTVLSPAELAKLPRHELRVIAEGSSDSASVSGVNLWDILQAVGVPAAEASGRQRAVMSIRLQGADGQQAIVALVEVDPGFSHRAALVADQRNGKPLDAVEGPWRVIIPDDQRHARWIRGLVTIDVTTLRP